MARLNPNPLPALALVAGVALSLVLVASILPGTNYSSDASLKSLMVRQFAEGRPGLDLELAAPTWVRELWDTGLYPFAPPFVYAMDGRHYEAFPPFFAALTAPFYAALGEPGLYVLPLLSLWAVWLLLLRALRRLDVGPTIAGATLGVLALGTPLTLYGAMFWEHTLAAALALAGAADLLAPGEAPGGRPWRLGAGLLLGLAGWFRPECLCLAATVLVIGLGSGPREGRLGAWAAGALGVGLAVGGLLAFNLVAFGAPLGVHARQVLELDVGPATRAVAALDRLATMSWDLATAAPVAPACLMLALVAAIGARGGTTGPAPRLAGTLLLACALALPAIAAVVPNAGGKQLGPRYLLPLLPLLALAMARMARELANRTGPHRKVATAALAFALVFGGVENAIFGSVDLVRDYRDRVPPLLEVVSADPGPVVAVAHQYLAMDLAPLFDRKAVVRIEERTGFSRFAAAAHHEGLQAFLLVSYPIGPEPARITSVLDGGHVADCVPLHRIGNDFDVWRCGLVDTVP